MCISCAIVVRIYDMHSRRSNYTWYFAAEVFINGENTAFYHSFILIEMKRRTWHRNTFRITALLWGESNDYRLIPLTKGHQSTVWRVFILVSENSQVAGDLIRHDAHVTSSKWDSNADGASMVVFRLHDPPEMTLLYSLLWCQTTVILVNV